MQGISTAGAITGKSDGRHRSRLLAWIVLAFLAIAPIPLGGTPPLAWTVFGLAIGVISVFAAISWSLYRRPVFGRELPLLISQIGFALVCTYLVVQMLPIFGTIPVTVADGSTIEMNTISIAPGDTFLMLTRMLTFGLLFFLVSQIAHSRKIRGILLNGIVIVVTAHALHGLLALFQFGDTLLGVDKTRYIGSATSTFLNRNTFATFLAIGTSVSLTLAMRTLVRKTDRGIVLSYEAKSLLYLVAAAIMITTIVTTNSRAGLAVTLVGITVVLASTVARNVNVLRPIFLATPVVLVLFGIMFVQFGEAIWLRYEGATGDLDFRLELYRQVLDLIAQRPWTGFGGGTFELAFPAIHAVSLPVELTWNEAHNTYLELWADLGFVFGSIPILMAVGLFITLIVRLWRNVGGWESQTAALAALAIGGIHSLFDFSLEIPAVTFLFIAVCAIGLGGSATPRSRS